MTPEFNQWWDGDDLTAENPFTKDTPAYWAWEGWVAGQAAKQSEFDASIDELQDLEARACEIIRSSQEVVAWGIADEDGQIFDCITPDEHEREEGKYTVPLYAAPPTQPSTAYYLPNEGHASVVWVGLTDREMKQTWYQVKSIMGFYSFEEVARAIEAKLKEKNT